CARQRARAGRECPWARPPTIRAGRSTSPTTASPWPTSGRSSPGCARRSRCSPRGWRSCSSCPSSRSPAPARWSAASSPRWRWSPPSAGCCAGGAWRPRSAAAGRCPASGCRTCWPRAWSRSRCSASSSSPSGPRR
ncbi:MAG: hypothetical protein AVDCRST_MAG54-3836, partial [uncultured Actinomycetospora sp.]